MLCTKKLSWLMICGFLFSSNHSQANDDFATQQMKLANGPGAIGETGHLYLVGPGAFVRPFYNDVMGQTDKHLSGATQVAWMSSWTHSSLELRAHWRFITPSFQEEFGGRILAAPVGRYADWMETQASYAHLLNVRQQTIKLQASMGYGHVGNKGAKQIHRSIHKWIGSSLNGLDYTQQPDGYFVNRGIQMSLLGQTKVFNLEGAQLYSVGQYYNKFMRDIYLKLNHVSKVSEKLSVGVEGKISWQIDSKVYTSTQNLRQEYAAGLRWAWYRPSIKYVSPYLRGDTIGQIYLDPLAVYFDW